MCSLTRNGLEIENEGGNILSWEIHLRGVSGVTTYTYAVVFPLVANGRTSAFYSSFLL